MKSKRNEVLSNHTIPITEVNRGGKKIWFTSVVNSSGRRKQITAADKSALEQKLYDFYVSMEESEKKITVLDVFNAWNTRRCEAGAIALSTSWRTLADGKRFFGFQNFGEKTWKELSPYDFTAFFDGCVRSLRLDTKRVVSLRGIVKGIISEAVYMGLIDRSEWHISDVFDFSCAKAVRKKRAGAEEVFTDDEYRQVVDYMRRDLQNRSNVILLLICFTGLRVGEAVTLRFSDFDFDRGFVSIQRHEQEIRQDGKKSYLVIDGAKTDAGVRRVPVPDTAMWLLDVIKRLEHASGNDYIFVRNGERLHCHTARNRLMTVCDALNIEYHCVHKLRKKLASLWFDAGASEKEMMDSFGWVDISTGLKHYDRRAVNDVKNKEAANHVPLPVSFNG